MFSLEKLDKTIEIIEDRIIAKGCAPETISALANLIQARALIGREEITKGENK